jgi:hypothetical protein
MERSGNVARRTEADVLAGTYKKSGKKRNERIYVLKNGDLIRTR